MNIKKELAAAAKEIKARYASYKVADLSIKLLEYGVDEEDTAYIMQGGEAVKAQAPAELQEWLAGAMNRVEERMGPERTKVMRQDSACCLGGKRQQIARDICKRYDTVDARFEAFSKERNIIGGKAWKEDGSYYVSFWYAKPRDGYTCGCLHHVPKEPMNRLYCECCAGHIKHHFETALGVQAECTCVTSPLSTCGEEPCLFRLHIIPEKK